MGSHRSHEGYLFVDHRESPGLPEEMAIAAGRPVSSAKGIFEAPTYTCNHCQAVVVINPNRTRDREWCSKCDHHICDACGALKAMTNECNSMAKQIDETLERACQELVPTFVPLLLR